MWFLARIQKGFMIKMSVGKTRERSVLISFSCIINKVVVGIKQVDTKQIFGEKNVGLAKIFVENNVGSTT